MEFLKQFVAWFWLLWILSVGSTVKGLDPCNFPAVYNFGDSNSDTGGISAAFLPAPPPNGESFFGRPAGRVCDGRLVIDFMSENLRLPYLHAYLDSLATNFRNGANFATGGSTIRIQNKTIFQNGASPFSLKVQIWHFDQFKARTAELYKQARNPSERAYIPNPDDFSKALYTIDIGQNDLAYGFQTLSSEQLRAQIPNILDEYALAIQRLYQQGGRAFWIHNTGPLGCLPVSRFYVPGEPGLLDQHGCVKSHNEMAVEFNRQLKDRVIQWRGQFKDAAFTYVDIYTAKYQLITDAKNQGFNEPLKICCGNHEGHHVWCGSREIINGTEIFGASCGNPSTYVSWDGVHYSHAANHWIANHILNGALSDPPLPLSHACHTSP